MSWGVVVVVVVNCCRRSCSLLVNTQLVKENFETVLHTPRLRKQEVVSERTICSIYVISIFFEFTRVTASRT